jgi:hypothetical protein
VQDFASFDNRKREEKEQMGRNIQFDDNRSSHSSMLDMYGNHLKQQQEPQLDSGDELDERALFGSSNQD